MKKSLRVIIITLLVCVMTGLGIMLADVIVAKADGYFPSNTRKLYIAGPVEVHVYEPEGRLVAEYIEGVSEAGYYYSLLSGMEANGEWFTYLPQDSGYNVEIIATSDGAIDVLFERINNDYNVYYMANYYDIAVRKGDVLMMDYVQEFFSRDYSEKIEKPVDPLLKIGEKAISPSVEYKDEVPEYKVKLSSNNKLGGSVMNYSSSYTPGHRAMVYAAWYEDCSFTGWYEGDELVSTEDVYTFRIESDRELVAHFEGETAYGRNGVFRITIETEGDGLINGEEDMFVLDAYPVEISAVPMYGNEFVKWEVTGDCIIEDVYSATTVIKTTTENVKLKAVFRALEKPEVHGYVTKGYNICLLMGGYEGAIGYRVYVKEPGSKKYRKFDTVKKDEDIFTSCSYEVLKNGKYKFKVKAYKKVKGKKVWSEYSNVETVKVKK